MEKPAKTYKQYLKERDRLIAGLSKYKHILRGTIQKRGNVCGKKGCKCKRTKSPVPHGPYDYLSHRSRDKTQMIFLNKIKRGEAIKGLDEYKKLIDTIYRISEINFNLIRYYYKEMES